MREYKAPHPDFEIKGQDHAIPPRKMKPKPYEEKIEFLVQKWLDEAELQSILEYAADKLEEFYYKTYTPEDVENMYEEAVR